MTIPLGQQPIDDPLLQFAKHHPSLTVAGLTTALFVVKTMFVSHLNTTVALGLVAAIGPAELAAGMLALLFPTLMLLLAYAMLLTTFVSYARGKRAAVLFEASLLVTLFAIVTAPLGSLMLFVGLNSGAFATGYWFGRRQARRGGPPMSSYWSIVQWRLVGVALGVVFVIAAAPTAWLPAERYVVDGIADEQVGYFIEEDGEWVTVLQDADRSLVRHPASDIQARVVCTLGSPRDVFSTPIWNLANRGQARLPECR